MGLFNLLKVNNLLEQQIEDLETAIDKYKTNRKKLIDFYEDCQVCLETLESYKKELEDKILNAKYAINKVRQLRGN